MLFKSICIPDYIKLNFLIVYRTKENKYNMCNCSGCNNNNKSEIGHVVKSLRYVEKIVLFLFSTGKS